MFRDVLRSSCCLLMCSFAAVSQAQPLNAKVDSHGLPISGAVLTLAGLGRPVTGEIQVGEAAVLSLPVAVTAALQPSSPPPSLSANAFRKATRDAKP